MILGAAIGLIGGVGGGALLRRAWADRRSGHPALVANGWTLVFAALAAAAVAEGPVKGIAAAAAGVAVGALMVVARGRVRRSGRPPRDTLAPEPLEGPSRLGRGVLKFLLAGPLGMTAAMGIAFCYAAWAPGDARTRIIVGGLLMPLGWALAMTWTLADQRLWRALAVLSGTSVAGFALAYVGGIA